MSFRMKRRVTLIHVLKEKRKGELKSRPKTIHAMPSQAEPGLAMPGHAGPSRAGPCQEPRYAQSGILSISFTDSTVKRPK